MAEKELEAMGIIFTSDQKLRVIAEKNNLKPLDIYAFIKKHEEKPLQENEIFTSELVEVRFAGTGIGRKTLARMIVVLPLPGGPDTQVEGVFTLSSSKWKSRLRLYIP